MKRVLVVDDERGTRESLRAIFSGSCEVAVADGAAAARGELERQAFDLVLLDVMMPGMDGVAFLKEVQALYPQVPVIMVSALTSVRPVVEAMRHGAFDFVAKPFDVQDILRVARRAMETASLRRQVQTLQGDIAEEFPVANIVGQAPAFVRALEDLRRAADTEATVLITGESGTGKELAARLLHNSGRRRDEPFVAVHCAALPETLMESELFGHEKGAFTGADRLKPGRFELVGSGTLFLDEIGEMSQTTQVKLLRVLQEREFMRVGGTRMIRTGARIVAATSRNLREETRHGRMREDLFYRLSVVPAALPPLRERISDIPLLARHFLRHFRAQMDAAAGDFDEEAMALLSAYRWPGNVRELRNIVERMVVLHRRLKVLPAACLPEEFHAGSPPGRAADAPQAAAAAENALAEASGSVRLGEAVRAFERRLIEAALRDANGIQTRAAERLGTTRRILRYRMLKLGIEGDAFKAPRG
jgi:DNA-binding NtrC family response regulator